MRPAIVPVALLALLLLAPAALAQPQPSTLDLQLTPPSLVAVPAHETTTAAVGWQVTYLGPAGAVAAQASGLQIAWTHDCALVAEAPAPTQVAPAAGEQTATGSTPFTLDPARGVGGASYPCTVTGIATDDAGQSSGEVDVSFTATVAYDGNVTLKLLAASRQAGPQKQIRYPIEVTNDGNAPTKVVFSVVDAPGGKWNILVPEAVVVEPGATVTAIATVATPFGNGYNKGSGAFVLRAQPSNVQDDGQAGPAHEFTLHSKVRGWYVPGPGAPAAIAVLALAALAARRRA